MADTLIQGTTIIEDKRSEKGEFWSISGISFKTNTSTDAYHYGSPNGVFVADDTTVAMANVNLPNGAIIKNIVVYGSENDESYTLHRSINSLDGSDASVMATDSMNTETTIISNPIINNDTYRYFIISSTIDTTDEIYGARINYEF